jgi:hypothetical protein
MNYGEFKKWKTNHWKCVWMFPLIRIDQANYLVKRVEQRKDITINTMSQFDER